MKLINRTRLANHKMLQSFCVVAFLLFNGLLFSQDFAADFQAVQKFNQNEILALEFTVESHFKMGDTDTLIVYKGSSVRYNEMYYSKNGSIEIIADNNVMITADHKNKTLKLYSPAILKEIQRKQAMSFSFVDEQRDSVVYLGLFANIKKYEVFTKNNTINSVVVKIDEQNRLCELTINYLPNQSGLLTTSTKFSNYNTQFKKNDFVWKTQDFVLHKKKEYILTPSFEKYRLFNNIELEKN